VLWRVLIVLVLYIAVVFLLRFIPISLYTELQVRKGMPRQEALDTTKVIVFEHPIWSTVIGVINGLMVLPLVWFMIRVVEKRTFVWKEIGLNWRHNSVLSLILGGLLALLMYIACRAVDFALGSSVPALDTIFASLTLTAVIHKCALYIPLGFGEETVFRGYVQSRLVQRRGAVWGILIGSIVFSLLHIVGNQFSPVDVFSGVILWAAIGALYHWSKSIYLVGMFHGIMNILLNTLPFEGSEVVGLIVNSMVLLLVIVIGFRWSEFCRVRPNPT
jgi:membrane protease YdiL (CAAX protease family)